MNLTKQKIIDELKKNNFYITRMISGSKSAYCKRHPNNVKFFNANIIVPKFKKVWYGDLDLTIDAPLLIKIAKKLKTIFYVLYEMDARFDNENKPIKELIKLAKWNTDQSTPIYDKNWNIIFVEEKKKYLTNDDNCPKNKNICPGSLICQKCEFFIKRKWISMDPEGWYQIECNFFN